MKSYLSLVSLSAAAHKSRSRLTAFCIACSVFLVTGVFSMAEMTARQELARLTVKHGASQVAALLSSQAFLSLLPVAGVLFLLVLLAGILMIAGSMNSEVAQQTRQYGLLRCIGMSRRQVIRYVRRQALHRCRIALPAGLALGTIVTWILCAVMKYAIGGEWADMPQMQVSILGLCCGTGAGLLTVLLAAERPARKASDITPMCALSSGTADERNRRVFAVKAGHRPERALGFHHAADSRKNLLLMTGSFALSILLFFSFSVLVDLVNCLMPQSAARADVELYSEEGTIPFFLTERLREEDGIERVFGRRAMLDAVTDEGKRVNLISMETFDLEALKKDKMLTKGSRLEPVIAENAALLIGIEELQCVKLQGTAIPVTGRLRYDPFSDNGTVSGDPTLIVSDETFRRLTGRENYTMLLIRLDDSTADETVQRIAELAGDCVTVNDCRDGDTRGTYLAFLVCAYGFLAVLASVTVLNIVNSVSMSVTARMGQYGAMRAVGMSRKQLAVMVRTEAFTYAIAGCVTGLVLGLGFSRWLYGFLVTAHFPYAKWSFPGVQVLITAAFLLLSALAGTRAPMKRLRTLSVTETVHQL